MGGLVIEQALVLANSRPTYRNTKTSTVGVITLGTPHEGTPIAGYTKFLAMVKRNDPGLVKQLAPKEKELYNLSHDFAAEYKHLSITCFYEKLDNAYIGGQLKVPVVDQNSAVQVGREMMYLSANHSGLNKFSGVEDPNFKLVRDVIAAMVDKASERGDTNQHPEGTLSPSLSLSLLSSPLIAQPSVVSQCMYQFSYIHSSTASESPIHGLQAT